MSASAAKISASADTAVPANEAVAATYPPCGVLAVVASAVLEAAASVPPAEAAASPACATVASHPSPSPV